MATSPLIGTLGSGWPVEQAILKTYTVWIDTYLAAVEEENGLSRGSIQRPPDPESIHGGSSEEIRWKLDELPAIIVVVEPDGEPEVSASVGYIQPFEVKVFCIVYGNDGWQQLEPEDTARAQAYLYGAAVQGLLQHSGLQDELPNLQWVRMIGAPKVEVPDPDKRREQYSLTTFRVWVAPVIQQQAGPTGLTPETSPGYTDPEVPFEPAPVAERGSVVVTEPGEESRENRYPSPEEYPDPGSYPA